MLFARKDKTTLAADPPLVQGIQAAQDDAPGVMIYQGKQYAVGLLWFTVQEEKSKELLKQRLGKTRADYYCLRQHISQQQGFGWLRKGHKRGLPVAAAMVADQLVGEWHGVFEADNGWWYVQVRSDTITPTGDRFFTSEEEAYNVFQAEMQRHNWPHAYAPGKWGLGEAVARELPLKNLLDDLATTTLTAATITALFGGTKQRNSIVGLILLAFFVMGGLILQTVLHQDDAIPMRSDFVPRQVQPNAAVLEAVKTTLELVSPQQMTQQCGKALADLLQPLPGWKMQQFTCGGGKASLAWQQVSGTLIDAKAQGRKVWPTTTAVTFNNRLLTANLSLDKLPTILQENLPTQDEALVMLEQVMKPLGALQIKPVIPTAPPVPPRSTFAAEPPPPPPAPPPYLEIQFISGFSPDKITPLIGVAGFEIVQIEWLIPRGVWQYKFKWTCAKTNTVPAAVKPLQPITPTPTAAPQPAAGGQK